MTDDGHPPRDARGRPLRDLRLSVTDRCNLRCRYCMPEESYTWLPRDEILSFGEASRVVDAFVALGVRKVRLTGGEPLLRRGVAELVAAIAANPGIEDLAMTTNGVRLAQHAAALRAAGLGRVTVSLDTLRPERFEALSRRDRHGDILEGLRALGPAGFAGTKIDTVVLRGVNDDELAELIEFGATVAAEVRFIEYMDVGGASGWDPSLVVGRDELLQTLTRRYGPIVPLPRDAAPAGRFALPDGRTFGIVASMTNPFCGSCDRSRVTADGMWYRCLYARVGTDLRTPLRRGVTDAELRGIVRTGWAGRRDQAAVERRRLTNRGPAFTRHTVSEDTHLEMHTRGG